MTHNPASAEALADVLQEEFPGQRPTLLIGMLADKNGECTLASLAPLSTRGGVPVSSERGLPPGNWLRRQRLVASRWSITTHWPVDW